VIEELPVVDPFVHAVADRHVAARAAAAAARRVTWGIGWLTSGGRRSPLYIQTSAGA
jgi:hypothetical protein